MKAKRRKRRQQNPVMPWQDPEQAAAAVLAAAEAWADTMDADDGTAKLDVLLQQAEENLLKAVELLKGARGE